MSSTLAEDVLALMKRVNSAEILPRWKNLSSSDSMEKGPGDWVTVSDIAAEHALRAGLANILPGIPTVGEEETASDSSVLERLNADAWVIDPIDGTSLYRDGKEGFGVMVGLVRNGHQVGGWLLDSVTGRSAMAIDGVVSLSHAISDPTDTFNFGLVSYSIRDFGAQWLREDGVYCPPDLMPAICGPSSVANYMALAYDEAAFHLAFHSKPWDHVAGVAVAQAVGCTVNHFDGAPYSPSRCKGGVVATSRRFDHEAIISGWIRLQEMHASKKNRSHYFQA